MHQRSEQSPIRVMLVDDHAVVRSGLSAFLLAFDDFELVGEAADGAEAVGMCERSRPDVILMDLVMPRMDGATATRTIRERHPDVQVIALTSFKEDELVQNALKSGAIGYLLKNVSADELATGDPCCQCRTSDPGAGSGRSLDSNDTKFRHAYTRPRSD